MDTSQYARPMREGSLLRYSSSEDTSCIPLPVIITCFSQNCKADRQFFPQKANIVRRSWKSQTGDSSRISNSRLCTPALANFGVDFGVLGGDVGPGERLRPLLRSAPQSFPELRVVGQLLQGFRER